MGKKDFEKFLKDQEKQRAASTPFDPKKELEEWKGMLDQLYGMVEDFINDYRVKGQIEIAYKPIQLKEEFSGPYEVRSLRLKIAGGNVSFVPIGTMLMGTKGRVDMVGPTGTAQFILVDKESNRPSVQVTVRKPGEPKKEATEPRKTPQWTWKIIGSDPRMTYVELTQESFLDVLMEVLGA